MSEPTPGTNIHLIWTEILTDELLSYTQIKEKIQKFHPHINPKSFHVHLKSLVKRGFASKEQMDDGQAGFRRHSEPLQSDLLNIELPSKQKTHITPVNLLVLKYLKKHIGKKFSASDVKSKLKLQGSAVWDILKIFAGANLLKKETINKKIIYTVLPAIKDCENPPSIHQYKKARTKKKRKSAPQSELAPIEQPVLMPEPQQELFIPNVADMTMGQVFTYVTNLRDENLKLKHTIETMVHMAIQSGVVEQE